MSKTVVNAMVPERAKEWIRRRRRVKEKRGAFLAQLRPSDVFLVGHPKSGNTWVTYMMAALVEHNFGKRVTLANLQEFIPAIHASDSSIATHSKLPDPRMFRNEGPKFADLYPKTIYILRDPRSVLVSYYHHCLHDTRDTQWRLDDFVDEMLQYGCIRHLEPYITRWDTQVLEWLHRAKHQRVKFVKYEELKKDRRKVLQELAGFVGLSCTEEDLGMVVERGSFDSMRREEAIYGAEPYSGTRGEGGFFMRRGTVNGWKDELSADAAKRIEAAFGEVMKKVGYFE